MTWDIWTVLNNSSWNINNIFTSSEIIKIIIIFFMFLWIISIIWTAKDISHRTKNLFHQSIHILLVTILSPLIGLPIYFILRPIHYHKDKLPRREAEVMKLLNCYNCRTLNFKTYDFCTNCGEPLKIKCKKCWNKCCYTYAYCNECWWPIFEN